MQKIPSFRIMFPLDVKHRWIFVVKIAILFYGMFPKNIICDDDCHDSTDTHHQNRILVLSTEKTFLGCNTSSHKVCLNGSLIELCFKTNETNRDSCNCRDFNCEIEIQRKGVENYSLVLNKSALFKQHIMIMTSPLLNTSCLPSKIFRHPDFIPWILQCMMLGDKNIDVKNICRGNQPYDEEACKDKEESKYYITINDKIHCMSCELPGKKPELSLTMPLPEGCQENTTKIMDSLGPLLEMMGNFSTAAVTIGDIKGVISKLPKKNQPNINLGIKKNGDMNFLENNNYSVAGFSRVVQIPKEASALAVKRNGTFAGVLLFPGIHQDNPNSYLINNEMVGIEMGADISNLTDTIDILYTNVDKKGDVASCRSWDGKGKQIWVTDGCETKQNNGSITCKCSHLTFFAILMSPPPGNITSSDYKSLTYITSIGCGLSMFFLAVAIFMHFLIRKGKSNQATKILMNLFVAMFTMNLSFLINETIANIGNYDACVVMAAVMHYSLLATFTWFFMEALHLCCNLWKLPTTIKHYMAKICIAGWVTPAIVVIVLLALKKYGMLVITTDGGNSAKMCWITDAAILQGVNVGYYAVVFVFTSSIFIITVRQIVLFSHRGKTQGSSSNKTNTFSILALFLLMGLTWAFAFFSHGPLLIPSYYIFTILNSLQGFFLFIYYYNSSKNVGEDKSSSGSSSSTATSNTVDTSPYK